jgi:hypothetical protein
MTDRCSCDKCKLCGAETHMSHVVPLAVFGIHHASFKNDRQFG